MFVPVTLQWFKVMKYINILTHLRQKLFEKQLPKDLEERGYCFRINSNEDISWDYVVVFEDINEIWNGKCKQGGLIFFSGEPPIVKVYSKIFLDQFDYVVSAHKEIKHKNSIITQQSLPWYFGYDFNSGENNYSFEDLVNMPIPTKQKTISFITSNRDFLPGHINRVKLLKNLQYKYSEYIDFFGKGIQSIGDKAEAILPYQFSLCIENSYIYDYWSEKIADALLGFSVPIYFGCRNINQYFSEQSYIFIDINKGNYLSVIENIINNADALYKTYLPQVIEARNKLLYRYNVYYAIISLIDKQIKSGGMKEISIHSSQEFHDKDFANILLKMKRICIKSIEQCTNRWI